MQSSSPPVRRSTHLTARGRAVAAGLAVLLVWGVTSSLAPDAYAKDADAGTPPRAPTSVLDRMVGEATWYAPAGRAMTASGQPYDPQRLTAAHEELPFGTRVRVTDADGDSVVVRINDRMPETVSERIDLSPRAFAELADPDRGRLEVTLEVLHSS